MQFFIFSNFLLKIKLKILTNATAKNAPENLKKQLCSCSRRS